METPLTPTELLIERMETLDDCNAAFVILRRSDGTISYRAAGMGTAELLGVLRFTTLSVEHDLVEGWKEQ